MIYLIVLLVLLLLSFRYDINGKTEGRDQCYLAIQLVLILIAGLRYRFAVDTIGYLNSFYYVYPDLLHLDYTRLDSYRHEPLWVLLNSVVKTLGGKFFIVQIIQASIVNILFFKYFKRHSAYPFLCATLFYIMDYHYFCMMIMRNATAIAICLFANDYILEKKWKKAFLLYGIAFLFHYSTFFIILITPFSMWLRLNRIGIALLLSMFVVGKMVGPYFDDLFALLAFNDTVSGKLDNYLENGKLSTDNVSIYYYLSLLIPFLYTFISLYYLKKRNVHIDLLRLEPFIMIGLMFVILRVNIGMIHRFTRLYSAYFILFCIQFFMDVYNRRELFTKSVSLVRSFIVFIPFFFVTVFLTVRSFSSYYPYYTIIDKKVDKVRDKYFLEHRPKAKKLSEDDY